MYLFGASRVYRSYNTRKWAHLGLDLSQGEEVVLDSLQNSTLIPVVGGVSSPLTGFRL